MTSYVESVINERKKFTPKDGFNVCIFDEMGRPGEMLELVAHTDTKPEAEKIKQTLKGQTVYIYSSDEE
jgi:hypothetical protein